MNQAFRLAFVMLASTLLLAVLGLWQPHPTLAQSEMSPTILPEATLTPLTVQRVVIDPDHSVTLTEAELAARLKAAPPGQSLIVTMRRPMSQAAKVDHAINTPPLLQAPASAVINNWTHQMTATFEGDLPLVQTISPPGLCQVYDYSQDGYDRTWGKDNLHVNPYAVPNSQWAAWPARDGTAGVNPAYTGEYPAEMDSWIECGPFDLSQMDDAYAQFWLWMDIPDTTGDYVAFGASTNGITYTWHITSGMNRIWQPWEMWFTDFAGESSVWLAWRFVSDDDIYVGPGVWLDDINVWAYDEPLKDCDALDSGFKGLVIPTYWQSFNDLYPFFTLDPAHLDKMKDTSMNWARIEFIALPFGTSGFVGVNFRDYDMIVDSLCGQDIATLGLIDYRTLARQDWNDHPIAYRNEFTRTVQAIVSHFKDRVDAWEIWNEEDHPTEVGHRFSLPENYADLLKASYETVKTVDPAARVIFGGTYGVQGDSRDFLQRVYQQWGAGQSYLDFLGVHPYWFKDPQNPDVYILNPDQYLHYDRPTYPTMLAKFLETMSAKGDSNKKIWVTEIGWNSAHGDPNVGPWANKVVTRQLQADYLTASFDILFNEVEHWNQPGAKAVAKVFWYFYWDYGEDSPVSTDIVHGDIPLIRPPDFVPQNPAVVRPAYFGLYTGDMGNPQPKPAFFNYKSYPARPSFIYLPVVLR